MEYRCTATFLVRMDRRWLDPHIKQVVARWVERHYGDVKVLSVDASHLQGPSSPLPRLRRYVVRRRVVYHVVCDLLIDDEPIQQGV